jgi:hypothetical protein
MTVDTLGLAEDGVVCGEEEIVEKLEQTGILVLLGCQQTLFFCASVCSVINYEP